MFSGGYPVKIFVQYCWGWFVGGGHVYYRAYSPHRIKYHLKGALTWKNRIETFIYPEKATADASRQVEYAKMAVAEGGLVGKGAGKSVMKNLLSQSTSDFIFAIIIEEYGFVGRAGIVFLFATAILGL